MRTSEGSIDYKVVNLICVSSISGVLCQLMYVFVWKESTSNNQIVSCTEHSSSLTIFNLDTADLFSYRPISVCLVTPFLCGHPYKSSHRTLACFPPQPVTAHRVFCDYITVICLGITVDDSSVDPFLFYSDLDDSGVVRFPF